jgi:crossover junction endodeoxyribonuclease RusA
MIVIITPYPPSVNHYYGQARSGKRFIKPAGIEYRIATKAYTDRYELVAPEGLLCVAIQVYPPDKRRRDIDNLMKASLDSLQHAGVYEDDSLIHDLHLVKMPPVRGGMLRIFISQFKEYLDDFPQTVR